MRIELLKIWVLGRSRFQVRLVDGPGQVVKLLADDVSYFGALDVVVRWKARARSPLVSVKLRCAGTSNRGLRASRLP